MRTEPCPVIVLWHICTKQDCGARETVVARQYLMTWIRAKIRVIVFFFGPRPLLCNVAQE
jgi:hypothetical protein